MRSLRLRSLVLSLAVLFQFPYSGTIAAQELPASSSAGTFSVPSRITQAIDEHSLVTLPGNVHPLARPEFDQGLVPDATPLKRILLLLRRSADQEASLQKLLDDQQSKSSTNYHAWLTPEQFGKQYGPADADIQTLTQWLTAHGFSNISVGPGKSVMEFSGNVGQVRSAFHTEIHHYVLDGKDYSANSTDPQIPEALTPVVAGIVSLHNFPRQSHAKFLGQFRRTIGRPGLEPLFTFPNPSNGQNFYGMGPGDFATIYNSKPLIAAGNDGTGQTIAIVGETDINVADVQAFRQMFGLSANYSGSNVILNGEDPGITSTGEEGEADLDNEWSGAVAPGAIIKFVVSASTPTSSGIDLSAVYIVEHNLAGVMSESYGTCENALGTAGNAFFNALWEQASSQGITVILSSGDGGSAGCDDFNKPQPATRGLAVSGMASTPFNVSVGGTDFDQVNNWAAFWSSTNDATGTSAKSYIPEIPWNENCAQIGLTGCGAGAPQGSVNIVAGSGGQSSVYSKPTWQLGASGMPNDNHRDQPDISLFASPGFDGTGYVFCQSVHTISGAQACNLNNGTLDFGIIGGTSASAPAFAGVMALVNQKQSTSTNLAPRQGNANYVLYALAKKSGASCTSSATETSTCVFNDVTKGNSILPTGRPGVGTNSVPCQGGTVNCSSTTEGSNGVLVSPSSSTTEAWTATAGYDMTSGLGSVNINSLATSWGTASTIATTTTLTLSPTTGITHGSAENVTVAITVKPNTGTATPTGDVSLIATFPDKTTRGFDHFTLDSTGTVSGVKTQSLPGGTYNVSAHYAGDGTNAPSDSPSVQITVGPESSQTFIAIPAFDSQGNPLSANATTVSYGSNYILRMYVTDKNGVAGATGVPSPACFQENALTCPSGTVTLTANSAPVDVGGGGPGVYNLNDFSYTRDLKPALTGGTYSLVAKYSGDNSYQPSTSATDTFAITPAPGTQLVFTSSPNTPVVGSPANFILLGIPGIANGATATGTVSLFDGSTLIAGPLPVSCTYCAPGEPPDFNASAQVTFSTSGNHSVSAKYSGDNDYAAATASTLTVDAQYTTTMTVTPSMTNINYGQSVTITATVVGSGKTPTMTGAFTFNATSTQIPGPVTGTPGTDASGNQTLTATVTTSPQSSEVVVVNYSGDSNFASAFTITSTIAVNIPDFTLPQNTAITVTAGQQQTASINVTPLSTTPSTVTLSLGPPSLPPGMSLSFNPSSVNLNGSAVPVQITVNTTGPSAGTSAAQTIAQVKHPAIFPGKWTWWSGSFVSGLVLLVLLWIPGGPKRYRAVLPVSVVFILTLALGCGGASTGGGGGGGGAAPTSITITTSQAKVTAGSPFTLTATVTSTKALTGTVNIFQGHPPIGIGVAPPIQVVNGKASVTVTNPFGPGTYEYWAQYTGDPNNLASQTTTSVQEVLTGPATIPYVAQTGGLSHQATITVNLQ